MKLTDEDYRKIDNHPYTLHRTYTGEGCAMCGRSQEEHDPAHGKFVDGDKFPGDWILILPRPERTALTDLYETSEFKEAWKLELECNDRTK